MIIIILPGVQITQANLEYRTLKITWSTEHQSKPGVQNSKADLESGTLKITWSTRTCWS